MDASEYDENNASKLRRDDPAGLIPKDERVGSEDDTRGNLFVAVLSFLKKIVSVVLTLALIPLPFTLPPRPPVITYNQDEITTPVEVSPEEHREKYIDEKGEEVDMMETIMAMREEDERENEEPEMPSDQVQVDDKPRKKRTLISTFFDF